VYVRTKRDNPTLSEHANLDFILHMKTIFPFRCQNGMSCLNQTKTHKASPFGQSTCHLANLQVMMPIIWFYFKTRLAFGFQNGGGCKKNVKKEKEIITTIVLRLILCLYWDNIVHFLFAFFILLSCSNKISCWHQQAIKLKLFVNNVSFWLFYCQACSIEESIL
jgi:hypothetical protein